MLMGHEGTTSGETMIKGDILYFSKGCVVSNISFQSYKNIISTHYIISSKNTKIYRKHDSLFHYWDRIFWLPAFIATHSCIFCKKKCILDMKASYLECIRIYKLIQKYKKNSKIIT